MEYRLYFLDAAAHIQGVKPYESDSDETAVAIAERTAEDRPFELWNRDRLVVRQWTTELTE